MVKGTRGHLVPIQRPRLMWAHDRALWRWLSCGVGQYQRAAIARLSGSLRVFEEHQALKR